jgi:hypothetical protein
MPQNLANTTNSVQHISVEKHEDQEPRLKISIGSLTVGIGFENGSPRGPAKGNIVVNSNLDDDLIEVSKSQLISNLEKFISEIKKMEQ